MAQIHFLHRRKKVNVPNETELVEVCKDHGIEGVCKQGNCWNCRFTVIEGLENLSEPTQVEIELQTQVDKADKTSRLACQSCLLKGNLTIKRFKK